MTSLSQYPHTRSSWDLKILESFVDSFTVDYSTGGLLRLSFIDKLYKFSQGQLIQDQGDPCPTRYTRFATHRSRRSTNSPSLCSVEAVTLTR